MLYVPHGEQSMAKEGEEGARSVSSKKEGELLMGINKHKNCPGPSTAD